MVDIARVISLVKEISIEVGDMDCVKLRFGREEDLSSEISGWMPKKFTCSFCKREFRSAQALGGHMNVHRRDRARLRLLPPNSILSSSSSTSSNPNPNNPTSSYFSLLSPPSSLMSSSFLGAHKNYMMMFKGDSDQRRKGVKRGSVVDYCGFEVVKKDEKRSEMIRDPNNKEEVDLELRLGHL